MPRPDALRVLILSPDPRVHGGVSAFIELMKTKFTRVRTESLWVGSIQGEKESKGQALWRLFSVPFSVIQRARSGEIDVIHLNPSLDLKSAIRDGLILLALRLIHFHRVMVFFHGWETTLEQKVERNPLLRNIMVWLLNPMTVYVLAPEFKTALVRMGVKEQVIHLAKTMFDGEAIRQAQSHSGETADRSVLFMSRFVKEKGVYELVQAFSRIAPIYPDLKLIMAGDGTEREGLQQLVSQLGISERVTFTGYVQGNEKFNLLVRCSVYALPTYYPEGMPVALLEAMGAGKPVLTAKAGVIPHIIKQPENGVVLDEVTVDSVESALRMLLGDPRWLIETAGTNARYAWQTFEASAVSAEIELQYENIAKGGA